MPLPPLLPSKPHLLEPTNQSPCALLHDWARSRQDADSAGGPAGMGVADYLKQLLELQIRPVSLCHGFMHTYASMSLSCMCIC